MHQSAGCCHAAAASGQDRVGAIGLDRLIDLDVEVVSRQGEAGEEAGREDRTDTEGFGGVDAVYFKSFLVQ